LTQSTNHATIQITHPHTRPHHGGRENSERILRGKASSARRQRRPIRAACARGSGGARPEPEPQQQRPASSRLGVHPSAAVGTRVPIASPVASRVRTSEARRVSTFHGNSNAFHPWVSRFAVAIRRTGARLNTSRVRKNWGLIFLLLPLSKRGAARSAGSKKKESPTPRPRHRRHNPLLSSSSSCCL
jgi:hypothetical protein